MDIQEILNNAVFASRQKELANSPQLLLGEMILKLEAIKNKSLPLFIDLMDKRPMGIESWRGRYAELAIETETFGSVNINEVVHDFGDGYKSYNIEKIGKENPTVEEWIEVLKKAIGRSFCGYKGDNFLMSKNTPVWLAEYGNSSFKINNEPIDEENYSNYKSVYFIDVEEKNDKVYLITKIEN